jgi:hypothetical protein
MKIRHNRFLRIIGFMVIMLTVTFTWSCSSSKEAEEIPEYIKNVEVSVKLGPSGDLTDMGRDDLFFTARNTGDKTVKELNGDIVFYMPEGEEAGRVSWIFVQVNDAMEDIAVGEKKAKWRPLPPESDLVLGSDKVIFFAGDDRPLQEKLEPHWDSVEAEVAITKLLVE